MTGNDDFDHLNGSEIALIGMSGRFPGARSVAQFWENLRDGVEALSYFSDQEMIAAGADPSLLSNPDYVRAGMVLDDIDLFDASFFGYNPREAEVMDPQHRFFLECAWEALESAGYNSDTYQGMIGVYAGVGAPTYLLNNILANPRAAEAAGNSPISMGNGVDFLTTRVAYQLNLKGPSWTLQSACSTSLVAVHQACLSLLSGECDMALVGGTSINTRQGAGYLYKDGGISSPDGHCRAFDAQAQGTIGGCGVAVVVLKNLTNAIADGDCIHAVIKGSAVNNDGSRKVGFTAPSVEGQAAVIVEALSLADVEPETISYVEAHGTATPMGDPIELAALTKAFRRRTNKKGFCAIGSLKTNVGHLDTASGVAGLIKTALSLKHKLLPPSLHYSQPNPGIDFENSPFYVNTSLAQWKNGSTPLRAGVSSFGIGGTNAHVILEEAPQRQASGPARPWQLITLSAKTGSALETMSANLSDYLQRHTDVNIADLAYTYNVGRRAFNERRVLICRDREDAIDAIKAAGADSQERVFTASIREERAHRLAFMFTGQGSQYVNMGLELYRQESGFREEVDRCSEILRAYLGVDLRQILFPVEEQSEKAAARLDQTLFTQPALFVIEYALSKLWMAWGLRPQALIGHSIGEYVAACLSGVFSLEDALSLVAVRGQIMQAAPGGAMLSVALSEEETGALLGEHLSLAAINGPSLCVVSGITKAIDELESQLVERGVAFRRLHTSHAFHSKLVEPLMSRFAAQLKKVRLNPPQIPYLSNVTGDWIKESQATDPLYWAKHLRQPVLFAAGIHKLLETPGRILLEVGPGNTLSTLARQQAVKTPNAVVLSSLRHPSERRSDSAHLLETIGKLWLAGARIDWQAFYAVEKRQRLSLPTYPFERRRYWVEPQKRAQRSQPPTASPDKKTDLADWFYLPSWKRSNLATALKSSAPSTEEKQQSVWLVFTSECSLAARVLSKLSEEGQTIITVAAGERFQQLSERAFIINPDEGRDYDTLLGELQAQAIVPQHVLHLWNIESADSSQQGFDSFEKAQSLGFYSLLYLAQALGKWCPAERIRMLVVSSGIQEVTGDETLRPEKATLLGPCKVIPQEHPNIICRSVDVIVPSQASELEERIAGQLLIEQETQTRGEVIAYRGTHRWVQSFEPMRLEEIAERPLRLRREGVYLITGGLGNIGLELAAYLGQTLRARVVLVGRRGLPAREEWAQWLTNHPAEDELSIKIRKLQAIEETGGEVLFVEADVSDEKQMGAAIEEATRRFGRIHGVIHAAGAIAGESLLAIRETGAAESERQFRPKAYGLLVLEKALQGRKLDFCLLFSSLSSVLGGLGFIAYAAANIFMDVFAHKQNQLGHIPWLSVNWDGWQIKKEQTGVQATTAAGPVMTPEEGLKAFRHILSVERITQVIVSTADLDARINRWVKLDALRETEQTKAVEHSSLHARPALQGSYVAPRNETEQAVAAIWQTLLGIEQVGVHDNFFELGGHSLLGIQLMSRLRQDFQLELPLRTLFETPTIEALAAFIERARSDEPLAGSPQQIRIERRQQRTVEELLLELEQDVNEQATL